ncbi:calpain-B-like [Neodiprion virginianus]|uniref:calpain-B-like n=1 Tax=Neodiprion virginianus TaxID=2961670 RepID=UPI001EE702C3|nr:calpain-B-like [Neodiprion virginianus]
MNTDRKSTEKIPKNEAGQDFYKLRKEWLAKKTDENDTTNLFVDLSFPAQDSSLYPNGIPNDKKKFPEKIVWKRPWQIVKNPQFFVDGISRFDAQQRAFDNCWVIASLPILTTNPKLFYQVVPEDQSFQENYAGIFHFRFWHYGKWVEIVIDDFLPTDSRGLLCARSPETNEFWISLVVKAYAKLYGSWEALEDGRASEALEDFTGGLALFYALDETSQLSFDTLLKAHENHALMVCGSKCFERKKKSCGGFYKSIWPQHGYSITGVVNYKGQQLLRMRNPWGDHREWSGPFGDKDAVWTVDADMRKALDFKPDADGEFFIPYEMVPQYFARIEICHLPFLGEGNENRKSKVFEGKWIRRTQTLESTNYLDAASKILSQNTQYRITLKNPDTVDGKCAVIVALMQKNRRIKRATDLTVGMEIYHLGYPNKLPEPLTADFFKKNQPISGSGAGAPLREVYNLFELKPGTYCIIPCIYNLEGEEYELSTNEEEEFLLRVFFGNIPNVNEAFMTSNLSPRRKYE